VKNDLTTAAERVFYMPKVGTWDRLFDFHSEGRRAVDFLHRKNPTASAGFEAANSGTRGQHANHYTNTPTLFFTEILLEFSSSFPW
jgi:hypothetical protein